MKDLEWMFAPDQAAYLNSLEERLEKLEELAQAPKSFIEPMEETIAREKQSPKVCPVTGMFLVEPGIDTTYFVAWYQPATGEHSDYHTWDGGCADQSFYEEGNCFATREDAERYAKHLKAMAKLRRLGGLSYGLDDVFVAFLELAILIPASTYNQLTPEEQNALMWPNEVSPSSSGDGKPTRSAEHNEVEK